MKIYSNQADNFIKNVKPGTSGAALIYGPDLGAIKTYQKQLATALLPGADSFAFKELTSDQVKDDPACLLDEVKSISFFAENRVIVVSDFASTISDIVTEALKDIPQGIFIIITTEEFGKDAKLKKFFEDHAKWPAIICYKEDARAIKAGVIDKFRALGIRMDADTTEYLTSNLGEDKQITLNEVEKILTYLGDQKELSFDEAVELLADSSELTTSDIAFALSTRNAEALEKSLTRAFAEKISSVAIIRGVQWHFQRLAQVKSYLRNGVSMDDALKYLRPAVFWKQSDAFKLSLRKWEEDHIIKALSTLTQAELTAKSQSDLDEEMNCRHSLLKIAA